MKQSLIKAAQKALNNPSYNSKKPAKGRKIQPIGMHGIPTFNGGQHQIKGKGPGIGKPLKDKHVKNMAAAAQLAMRSKKRKANIKANPDAFNKSGALKNDYRFTKGDGVKQNPTQIMKR